MTKFSNTSINEFVEIEEVYRTYTFIKEGYKYDIVVHLPRQLSVSESGGHRIYSEDGKSHYIPSGWVHIEWEVPVGAPNFSV